MDQALFSALRATGQAGVIQAVWVYEHAVDFGGLRRFHQNLGYGLLGRRIERSPLPFGRHRWVLDRRPSELDIAECARSRAELDDWADERSQLPTDPEWGPGWHLGVLPLTDGSTAVSLVVSHYLIDGLGLGLTVADAVRGNTRDLGYPPPRSRTRLRAVVQDARETSQDIPEVARALVAAAKQARRRGKDIARPRTPRPIDTFVGDGDESVVVPAITTYIDLSDWDARAKDIGGNGNSLLVGFAARLGARMGRRHAGDGAVTVQLPMSDRTEDDTRANALSWVSVSIDPTRVTTDLRDTRAAIKQTLTILREAPEESMQLHPLAPLAPFTPKRAMKRLADTAFDYANLPVGCSNLGDVNSLVCCLDGTEAEYLTARGIEQNVTRQRLEQTGGHMTLVSGRIGGKIGITVVAYQPGGTNSKPHLRELAASTLAEFDLTGVIA
ncbi:wax ester/triacylglycerol synthase family O-acyltransferase [Candidatus Mycobacterium methanotrophicum]|uniref:Wax ester/triacylglycerol synthase family O-acyltransferase n=2 Tax=Candidatus Mycobacterium methanotrophicum TaxID=2943498 RepID=A0ABY4QTR1_9MYCO|nr:wax ester/triacylglycerol synthase family O-acyltransferase [Candidatus Mycobacterium methanotrophicum]UQX13120.1 wax ester/triacylglycerol synthase family O-acyltransferase [Candidatus Mycobacterium methanotrophicum]